MLDNGADIEAKDEDDWTAIFYAAKADQAETVQCLLEAGAEIDVQDKDGWTPLICAAKAGQAETVKLLVMAGAKLNAQDKDGWTPLFYVLQTGKVEIVKFLLTAGADVNKQDVNGNTVLMYATAFGEVEIVKFLLTADADVRIQNNDELTALIIARAKENGEIENLLTEALEKSTPAEEVSIEEESESNEEDTPEFFAPPAEESDSTVDDASSDLSTSGSEAGERREIEVKGITYAFRWCPSGTFMMGSPEGEERRDSDEAPHEVELTEGFWLLETEVTVGMWRSFVADTDYKLGSGDEGKGVLGIVDGELGYSKQLDWDNPGFSQTDACPVTTIDWEGAVAFCEWLSQKTGQEIKLPTEAQWEYACRAGTTTPFNFGKTLNGDKANRPEGNKSPVTGPQNNTIYSNNNLFKRKYESI